MKNLHKDERGLEGLEYLLIAALVIIASVAAYKFLGKVSSNSIAVPQVSRAFSLGMYSYENGVPAIANPYLNNLQYSEDWLKGWIEAKKKFELSQKAKPE